MCTPSREHPAVAQALDSLLAQLELDGGLTCSSGRGAIVDALCRRLDELGILFWEDHVAIALVLEEAGWPEAASHARDVAHIDGPRQVADYLRASDPTAVSGPPRTVADYAPLAERVLSAAREGLRVR